MFMTLIVDLLIVSNGGSGEASIDGGNEDLATSALTHRPREVGDRREAAT